MRPPKRTHPIRYPPSPNHAELARAYSRQPRFARLPAVHSDDVPCTDTLLGTQLESIRPKAFS
jgi:hypothetical protein